MVACNKETKDFMCGVDKHIDVFGAVLGRMTHELDGLTRKVRELEERLAGLALMVIDTSGEEPSVEFNVGQLLGARWYSFRNVVRTSILVKDTEGVVGDSPPLRFTRSLHRLDKLVEDLVDQSQARDLSDYRTVPLTDLGDIRELFQL